MIGNDIVALHQKRSASRTQQFINRICTKEEKTVLKDFSPTIQLALFWSVKEASFKFFKRSHDIPFIPAKFQLSRIQENLIGDANKYRQDKGVNSQILSDENYYEMIIESEFGKLMGRATLSGEYVHSIVCKHVECFNKVHWGIDTINTTTYKEQSKAVREVALKHFQCIDSSYKVEQIEFRKTKSNVPVLFLNNQESRLFFSFSHHDQYVAYAWYG